MAPAEPLEKNKERMKEERERNSFFIKSVCDEVSEFAEQTPPEGDSPRLTSCSKQGRNSRATTFHLFGKVATSYPCGAAGKICL